VTLDCKVWPIW